ncbi:SLAP domain-containing protein [Lactobacillus huangpiensis]|uniref:SLAP domain-containing protein n=1 Tax=Lactobacillus huangpiensis TaxID=2799571 RepID=UPI001CC7882B|nr:SLAP domain-containing protein [Lactobacillus huangpiensis]
MKLNKIIITGIASVALLGTAVTTVSAAKLQLIRKSYVYNAKGKKTKSSYRKGRKIKVLGTKKIKGKKYYRIGKNKYVLVKNFKKKKTNYKTVVIPNAENSKKPQTPVWESKHVVDTLPSLTDQIKKALTLSGDDRLEADKEIAVKLGMSPDSVTSENQKSFEQSLNKYTDSMDEAKSWIEQGGPSLDQHMKDEQNKFGDYIKNGN